MTPLERAARAICLTNDLDPDQPIGPTGFQQTVPAFVRAVGSGPFLWERFVPHARAVLQAIREPSEEMRGAGMEITLYVKPDESDEGYRDDATNVWRMMVDAALEEG